jgi:membrane associated rhomboid family serine protease
MDPDHDRYSRAAIVLLALNIGIWLLQLATGVSPLDPGAPTLIAWGGNLPLFTLTGDTWRLATAMFLHGGVIHLGLNMLALAMTANRTADEYGSARMLVIFVAGGILASCASALWAERHAALAQPVALVTVSVGASGAVMALFGALLVALLVTPPRFMALPPDERPGNVDWRLVAVVAANVALGFVIPHVDQAAHIGGLLAGMAIGGLMAVVPTATDARATLARYVATVMLVTAGVGALLHFAPQDKLVVMRAVWTAKLAPPLPARAVPQR